MFLYFVAAMSGAMLLSFSLGKYSPDGLEALGLIVVLVFLIGGIKNFIDFIVKKVSKND